MRRTPLFFLALALLVSGLATAAPDTPNLVAPSDGASDQSICANLLVDVSDPEGDALTVRFLGRRLHEPFTIVVLPDTQWTCSETQGGDRDMFYAQTDWIASSRAELDIAAVVHVGDLVNNGDEDPDQWIIATNAMYTLEDPSLTGLAEGIPYGIAPGNHDSTPNGDPDGSSTYFNRYFGVSHFSGRSYYGGHYGSNNDNHYTLFSGGGMDFVVLDLEYDPDANPDVLAWAAGVLAAWPDRLGIVSCHPLLYSSGGFDPQGEAVYEALSPYPNLFMMLSGHRGGEVSRTDVAAGTVHTMMADYQFDDHGGNGYLRILEIDPTSDQINVSTYSPWLDVWETDSDSDFSLSYDFQDGPAFSLIEEVPASSGDRVGTSWTGLQPYTSYQWKVELSDGETVTSSTWTFSTGNGAPVDADGDGQTPCDGDCDDTNARVWRGAFELCDGMDNDCDRVSDEGYDLDADGWRTCDGDCNDLDPTVNPAAPELLDLLDNNCDFRVDEGTAAFDDDRDGWSEEEGDCDDGDRWTSPGAMELPDGLDQDCDAIVDEGTERFDDDGDGFTERAGDCDDTDPLIRPGAPEEADDRDNDCDALVDEGTARFDDDGDSFTEEAGDCDDANLLIWPGAPELPDSLDQDCDGLVDEGTERFDDDGDGFTEEAGDCDDQDETSWPGAPERTDGRDQDCDGLIDEGTETWDDDGDGWSEEAGDCDDADATRWPGARELANGRDDDCDGVPDEGTDTFDDDGDRWTERQGDCDDTRADIYPGADEVEDGRDQDCDGIADDETARYDDDGDGYTEQQGDCDDAKAAARPGAPEAFGSGDMNCDGVILRPEGWGAGCDQGGAGGLPLTALLMLLSLAGSRARSLLPSSPKTP